MEFISNVVIALFQRGFVKCRLEAPKYCIAFEREQLDGAKVVVFVEDINGNSVSKEDLIEYKEKIIDNYLLRGIADVSVFFLVFSENVPRERELIDTDLQFWIVDMLVYQLIIYENQPENFCEIKEDIEAIITGLKQRKKELKHNFPFATIALLIANFLVFIIMSISGSTEDVLYMMEHGAVFGPSVFEDGEIWRLVTALFLHFGALHLINNMLTLAIVGIQLERIIGSRILIAIYFLAGIGANIISSFYHYTNGEMIVSAGASGAIFALVGALAVVVFRTRKRRGFDLRYILLIVLVIYDSYANPGVDAIAHIVGLILGAVLAFLLISNKRLRFRR